MSCTKWEASQTPVYRKRRPHRIVVILAFVLLLSLVGILFRSGPVYRPRVSTTHPPPAGPPPQDHHLTKDTLVITLNKTDSTTPSVRVTLTNYHFSTKVSVLMWDSPFDDQAVPLGIFEVTDRATGKKVAPLGLRIDRLLPPKSTDFLDLKPRHAVTKDVGLVPPGIELVRGRSYNVKVTNHWKGVWHANGREAGEQRLRLMGGPTGLIDWEYSTNSLQVDVL